MNYVTPNYCNNFKCIADQCKHNCCIGWEIDIDESTFEKYKKYPYIYKHISENCGAHFVLDKNERCPFLNCKNLCKIIINDGEEMLCQICNDHPRFRNFYSDRVEVGIGLCCEAAAKLILNYKDKAKLINNICTENLTFEEYEFLNLREQIFNLLQNRELSIDSRVKKLMDMFNIKISPNKLWGNYRYLERLDSTWDSYLDLLENSSSNVELPENFEIPFEQLLVYLVFRHLADYLDDGKFLERIGFIILSFSVIKKIFSESDYSMNNLEEIVRLYSSEIEYSDENINRLLDLIVINNSDIQQDLFNIQDIKYKYFQAKLMPTVNISKIIGVRTPILRKYAKTIANTKLAQDFLSNLPHDYYEENNLHGFLIERISNFENAVFEMERFLPFIDNWATCDSITPIAFKKNPKRLLPYIKKWISSKNTYTVRYGIKLLMNLFLDDSFDISHLKIVADITSEEYYVNMMRAWYFATALSKQYKYTLPYLQNDILDIWTHNKTIQKAIESYRISPIQKKYLKTLKRPSK